jgi:hypothetical protein
MTETVRQERTTKIDLNVLVAKATFTGVSGAFTAFKVIDILRSPENPKDWLMAAGGIAVTFLLAKSLVRTQTSAELEIDRLKTAARE